MAEAELKHYFAPGGGELEPDVVSELQSIMRLHELSAENLYYKWESFCIKMDMEASSLSLGAVRNLKHDIQDALERSNRAQAQVKTEKKVGATPRAAATRGGGAGGGDVFGMLDGLVPNTPGSGKLSNKGASAKKRAYETPSVSRVKAEVASSSPDYKATPSKMEDQLVAMQS